MTLDGTGPAESAKRKKMPSPTDEEVAEVAPPSEPRTESAPPHDLVNLQFNEASVEIQEIKLRRSIGQRALSRVKLRVPLSDEEVAALPFADAVFAMRNASLQVEESKKNQLALSLKREFAAAAWIFTNADIPKGLKDERVSSITATPVLQPKIVVTDGKTRIEITVEGHIEAPQLAPLMEWIRIDGDLRITTTSLQTELPLQ